jgi:hypothetical protein
VFYCDPFDGTVYDWDIAIQRREKKIVSLKLAKYAKINNNNNNSSYSRILYRNRKVINPIIFEYNDMFLNQLSDLTGSSGEL